MDDGKEMSGILHLQMKKAIYSLSFYDGEKSNLILYQWDLTTISAIQSSFDSELPQNYRLQIESAVLRCPLRQKNLVLTLRCGGGGGYARLKSQLSTDDNEIFFNPSHHQSIDIDDDALKEESTRNSSANIMNTEDSNQNRNDVKSTQTKGIHVFLSNGENGEGTLLGHRYIPINDLITGSIFQEAARLKNSLETQTLCTLQKQLLFNLSATQSKYITNMFIITYFYEHIFTNFIFISNKIMRVKSKSRFSAIYLS
jgi:hypothetical protein